MFGAAVNPQPALPVVGPGRYSSQRAGIESTMSHRLKHLLGMLALLLCLPTAWAQDTVAGTVKRLSGTVVVERAGQRLPLSVGMPVLRKDRIVTGTPGSVGITLIDDTLLSAGAATRLELSEVRFDSTSQDGKLWIRLYQGALHMITGLIAREAPQNVRIETPTAVMGVRGTEFIVETTGE